MRVRRLIELHWIALALLAALPARAQSTGRFADVARDAPPRESWGTAAARRMHGQALEHERRGDVTRALVAYTDALTMDGSYGPAWLGLGRLRAAMRDDREAERVLSTAARLPDVAPDALFERALLMYRTGQTAEAFADLEQSIAAQPSLDRVRVLSSWYVRLQSWPAALAAWRRLHAAAEESGDEPTRGEAALQLRALQLLAADADPVLAGAHDRRWVRRALARIARRQR